MNTIEKLPQGCIGHKDDFVLENGLPDYEKLAGCFIESNSGLVFTSNETMLDFLNPVEEEKAE